jgi:hypothetical protein
VTYRNSETMKPGVECEKQRRKGREGGWEGIGGDGGGVLQEREG